jgi:glycine dehydrogenase subunit 2
MIVHEALMFEPTETESKETLDRAIEVMREIHFIAYHTPQKLLDAPTTMPIKRVDDVQAARHPILKYSPEER